MSEKTTIYFLADEGNPLPEIAKTSLLKEDYVLKPYQPGIGTGEIFFIFSPLWDGKYYQSVESIWEKYMAQNSPGAKLLIIGSNPGNHPNYLDGFFLPQEWRKTIEALPSASGFAKNAVTLTYGLNIEERLYGFLMGHGNNSLAEVCKKLYPYLDAAKQVLELEGNEQKKQDVIFELSSGHAKALWLTLHLRWLNHCHIFTFLPFHQIFQELVGLMKNLEHIFEESEDNDEDYLHLTTKATPALQQMRNLLNELQVYV
jgi:hypothetical protein